MLPYSSTSPRETRWRWWSIPRGSPRTRQSWRGDSGNYQSIIDNNCDSQHHFFWLVYFPTKIPNHCRVSDATYLVHLVQHYFHWRQTFDKSTESSYCISSKFIKAISRYHISWYFRSCTHALLISTAFNPERLIRERFTIIFWQIFTSHTPHRLSSLVL